MALSNNNPYQSAINDSGTPDSGNSPPVLGSQTSPLTLSKYTKALIRNYQNPLKLRVPSVIRISVSQTVSFAAFLYEKMRNAVEFREDHLIRRAAIQRILKRRLILNENGRDLAEPLIKELLWARYYENNTIGEEKIGEIQSIIDKYFFIRNELIAGRISSEQEKISDFIIEVLSCEIQENLSPNYRQEAFTNYVYQILRPYILPFNTEEERDIQVYIAVERTFAHNDNALIRYHLLKLIVPEITEITWQTADPVLPKLYDAVNRIERDLAHPLKDKIRNIVKKQIPPFLILRDIFENNRHQLAGIMNDESKLKYKVDEACRKRYDESRSRLSRTAIRSFIYILLTKVIFAFILEIPYDLYILGEIAYLPIAINVIFPPILMTLIILSVTVPGDDNTRKIYQLIKGIIDNDPDTPAVIGSGIAVGKKSRTRGFVFTGLFTLTYLLTYIMSFGSIIYGLTLLKFNPVSQSIFIFFVTLVTFFAYRVIQITQEYQVVSQENFFSTLTDFFFLPIIRVGQWLSGEVLQRFNVFIFIFDFIIEMPFKAIVEVFDEWIRFVRLKKEEIV
ncbi:hypothetical protein A3D05_06510 [Candidatus Gottesmanbacteria bacterium RIFCSPHIGHO2_02_FULL_40_24]|uniref:Uncharacterized protein n=1 Tax=Candidatus Gottesmanbacteria bacterium RIFCSPHIGHO2_01_FULL_40_15 TaxID=1798376 RepID=A0A1F5Z382_9BACT|nr:MAG: hypothetical protein A2777_03560 [Candidatus Gottesmanbacteria bacterium RIFCSPHIGHO2_01_FULL_40_15]OGG17170.1 MAG: hypothetical protein A3D05_06510 [Candidatus Gottesmanbacteria bacterium RIFCSPHIGHO2_02_FULL_40_24]OGG21250.1 MAG: hypothetical protein A3B48_05030 [Candidatus Gottesmanbacteria bacterium RIFCSPLOWO2_01_FULL_40_10]OGG32204.1 MAG: hypothetical protein A3I80_04790 [Candidatus Gottesmanbacteria bacterium RIFCSPLOWO2_02_FULL_40_10]